MIEIIPLERKHLEEVLEIEKASFPEPWTREMFEREVFLSISHFFAAINENHVVGYGGYWHIQDEANIINLAVHPERRLKGIGREMLSFLLEHILKQGISRVYLEVRVSNKKALHLYESAGFKISGIRPRYYNNIEDALLMEKIF